MFNVLPSEISLKCKEFGGNPCEELEELKTQKRELQKKINECNRCCEEFNYKDIKKIIQNNGLEI